MCAGHGKSGNFFSTRPGGQTMPQLGLGDRGFQRGASGGEVQIHRDFVREQDGEVRDQPGLPGGSTMATRRCAAVAPQMHG